MYILTMPYFAIGEKSAEAFDINKGYIFNLIKWAYENKDVIKTQLFIDEGVLDDEANRENAEVIYNDNSDTKLISFSNDVIPNVIVPSRRVDKIKELVYFLEEKPIALDYFYKQMQSIIKQRKTLSPLRKMLQILETEGNEKLRKRTIECFQKLWREEKIAEKKKYNDFWNVKTNNLNINYLRDTYNDNVSP